MTDAVPEMRLGVILQALTPSSPDECPVLYTSVFPPEVLRAEGSKPLMQVAPHTAIEMFAWGLVEPLLPKRYVHKITDDGVRVRDDCTTGRD